MSFAYAMYQCELDFPPILFLLFSMATIIRCITSQVCIRNEESRKAATDRPAQTVLLNTFFRSMNNARNVNRSKFQMNFY